MSSNLIIRSISDKYFYIIARGTYGTQIKRRAIIISRSLYEAFEPKTQTKTKTATDTLFDPDIDLTGKVKNSPTVSVPKSDPKQKTSTPAPELRSATRARTAQAAAGANIGQQGMRHMMDLMHNQDMIDVSNEPDIDIDQDNAIGYVRPEPVVPNTLPVVPETLPDVINGELLASGVEPEWHMVKNLPGYLQKPIRALGRQVFSVFTDTPIEDINVISTMTNERLEINVVSAFIKQHGERVTDAEIKFQRLMPGYESGVSMFRAKGLTFMLVEDFAGRYIYSWPSSDDKDSDVEGIKRMSMF